MQEWQLNNVAEVIVDVSAERLWAALTEASETERYFMGSRVTVGEVGEVSGLNEMTAGVRKARFWRRNRRIGFG